MQWWSCTLLKLQLPPHCRSGQCCKLYSPTTVNFDFGNPQVNFSSSVLERNWISYLIWNVSFDSSVCKQWYSWRTFLMKDEERMDQVFVNWAPSGDWSCFEWSQIWLKSKLAKVAVRELVVKEGDFQRRRPLHFPISWKETPPIIQTLKVESATEREISIQILKIFEVCLFVPSAI